MAASRWAKYYSDRYQPHAPILMGVVAMFLRDRLHRLALVNRQKDYLALSGRPELFQLHQRLNGLLVEGERNWKSYDYGVGYFYQSCRDLCVTGFRDTEGRVEAMRLKDRVSGKRLLEIGSNAGFISCQVATVARTVDACEIAPHLVRIGEEAATYLRISNCRFHLSSFEDFPETERFEAILSFANYSTYDGNSPWSLEDHLAKCRRMLVAGGEFLFESHPPGHEMRSRGQILAILEKYFHVLEAEVLDYGTFLDRGRLFVVARRVA